MAWRTIFVRSQSFLKVENSSLAVHNDGEVVKIPLEDIACLVLETTQATLTSAVLSEAAERGVAVFTCDQRHQPNGVLHSFLPHSRQTEILRRQLSWTQPFKNRIWRAMVQKKIRNQALCLDQLGRKRGETLRTIALRVKSGDSENREAYAAAVYFEALFGPEFQRLRHAGDRPNAALNYGYAILRGSVARALCAYGFLPTIGIHHDNVQNAFNLADDFIEPFRPFCDRLVAMRNWKVAVDDNLTPSDKQSLLGLLGMDCDLKGRSFGVLQATEQVVSSFAAATREGIPDLMVLPGLLPLVKGEYGRRNQALDAYSGAL